MQAYNPIIGLTGRHLINKRNKRSSRDRTLNSSWRVAFRLSRQSNKLARYVANHTHPGIARRSGGCAICREKNHGINMAPSEAGGSRISREAIHRTHVKYVRIRACIHVYVCVYVCGRTRDKASLIGGEDELVVNGCTTGSTARVIPTNLFDCASMPDSPPRRNKTRPCSSLSHSLYPPPGRNPRRQENKGMPVRAISSIRDTVLNFDRVELRSCRSFDSRELRFIEEKSPDEEIFLSET